MVPRSINRHWGVICCAAALHLGCGAEPGSTNSGGQPTLIPEEAVGEVQERLTMIESTGAVGHTMQLRPCAPEGSPCVLGTQKLAAFGVSGNLAYKVLTTNPMCTRASFDGANPAPGQARACYYAPYAPLIFNGNPVLENQTGRAIGTVAYGANGSFNFVTFTSATTFTCNNATFAKPDMPDPAFGVHKACYVLADYDFTTIQGANISTFFTPVAYGANGHFFYQVLSGTVRCDDSTFGNPISGVPKFCYLFPFPLIAFEGGSFSFGGRTGTVAFGSGTNGVWLTTGTQGGPCTVPFFANDPDPRVTKACYGQAP